MINILKYFNKRNNNTKNTVACMPEETSMQEELKLKNSAIETSMNAIAILDLSYRVIYVKRVFCKNIWL